MRMKYGLAQAESQGQVYIVQVSLTFLSHCNEGMEVWGIWNLVWKWDSYTNINMTQVTLSLHWSSAIGPGATCSSHCLRGRVCAAVVGTTTRAHRPQISYCTTCSIPTSATGSAICNVTRVDYSKLPMRYVGLYSVKISGRNILF